MPFDEFVTASSGADLCVLASALDDGGSGIPDSGNAANDPETDPLKTLASEFQQPPKIAVSAAAPSPPTPTPPHDSQEILSQVPETPRQADTVQAQKEVAQHSEQAKQVQEVTSHPVLPQKRAAAASGGDAGTGHSTPAQSRGSTAGERFSSNLSAFSNQWHTGGVSASPNNSAQLACSNRGAAQGSSKEPTSALPSIAASPAGPKASQAAPAPGTQSNWNLTEDSECSNQQASDTLNNPIASIAKHKSEGPAPCTPQKPCTHASCVACSHTRLRARMQGINGASRPESPVDNRAAVEKLISAIQTGAFVDEAVVPVHKFLSPVKTKCPPQPAMHYVHCYPPDEPMAKAHPNAMPRVGKQGPSEHSLFHDDGPSAPLSSLPSYGDGPSPAATPTWRLRGKLIPMQIQQCLPNLIGGGGRKGKQPRSPRATPTSAANLFSGCFPLMMRQSKLSEAYDDTASIEVAKRSESQRDGARTAGPAPRTGRTAGGRTARGAERPSNPVSSSPPLFRSTYHNPFFQQDDGPPGSLPVPSPSQKPSGPLLPQSSETVPCRSGVLQVTEEPVGHSQKSVGVGLVDASNVPVAKNPVELVSGAQAVQAAKETNRRHLLMTDRKRSSTLTSHAGSTTCPSEDKRRDSTSRPDGMSPADTSVGASVDRVSRSSGSVGGGGATGGLAASLWPRKKRQHRSKSPQAVQDSNGASGKFWRGIRNRIMHVQQTSGADSDVQASNKSLRPGGSTEGLSRGLFGSKKNIGGMQEHDIGGASGPAVFTLHTNTVAHSSKDTQPPQLPQTSSTTSRIGEWWQKLAKRQSVQDDGVYVPYEPPQDHSSVAVLGLELKSTTSHESEEPGKRNRGLQNTLGQAIEPGSLGSIFQTCH